MDKEPLDDFPDLIFSPKKSSGAPRVLKPNSVFSVEPLIDRLGGLAKDSFRVGIGLSTADKPRLITVGIQEAVSAGAEEVQTENGVEESAEPVSEGASGTDGLKVDQANSQGESRSRTPEDRSDGELVVAEPEVSAISGFKLGRSVAKRFFEEDESGNVQGDVSEPDEEDQGDEDGEDEDHENDERQDGDAETGHPPLLAVLGKSGSRVSEDTQALLAAQEESHGFEIVHAENTVLEKHQPARSVVSPPPVVIEEWGKPPWDAFLMAESENRKREEAAARARAMAEFDRRVDNLKAALMAPVPRPESNPFRPLDEREDEEEKNFFPEESHLSSRIPVELFEAAFATRKVQPAKSPQSRRIDRIARFQSPIKQRIEIDVASAGARGPSSPGSSFPTQELSQLRSALYESKRMIAELEFALVDERRSLDQLRSHVSAIKTDLAYKSCCSGGICNCSRPIDQNRFKTRREVADAELQTLIHDSNYMINKLKGELCASCGPLTSPCEVCDRNNNWTQKLEYVQRKQWEAYARKTESD